MVSSSYTIIPPSTTSLSCPSTSFATILIQLAISFQSYQHLRLYCLPSLIILSLNTSWFSPYKFHHIILGFLCLISLLIHLLIQIACTTTLCWVVMLTPGIILQSLQHLLSTFLVRMKSMRLTFVPLLKVIKCDSLFLNQVFDNIKSCGVCKIWDSITWFIP